MLTKYLPNLAVLFLSVVTAQAQTTRPVETDGSMTAPIGEPPPFRRQISDAEYQKRRTKVLAALIPPDRAPFQGAVVTDVWPDGQAIRLGIAVGDVIVAIDDHVVDTDLALGAARIPTSDTQVIDVWSAHQGKIMAVKLGPGKIGVLSMEYRSLEVEYLRLLADGEKANDDVRVAARTATTDSALAETALATADVHSPMVNLIAAEIASHDLRPEDALAYANSARQGLEATHSTYAAGIAYRSALATFRLPLAQRLAESYPNALRHSERFGNDNKPFDLADEIAAVNALSMELLPSPVKAFEKLHFTDHTHDLRNEGGKDAEEWGSQWAVDSWKQQGQISMVVPSSHFNHYMFGPADANIDFFMRAHLKVTDNEKADYLKMFTFALESTQTRDNHAIELSAVVEHAPIRLYSFGSNMASCQTDVTQQVGNDRTFTVRMTAVGNRCECQINGQRVFYGPLLLPEAGRKLCVITHFCGLTYTLDKLSFRTAPAR